MASIDFDGASPLRSVTTPHSTTADETGRYPFVTFRDLETDAALRIRKRRGRQLVGEVPGGGVIRAIHEFEYVNPANGLTTRFIFVATTVGVYQYAGGAIFNAMVLPFAPTGSDWGFLNFSNRCVAWNGSDPLIVFDGVAWTKVGIAAPAAAATYVLLDVYNVGSVFAENEKRQITGTVPAIWTAGMVDKPVVINGVTYRVGTLDVAGDGAAVAPKLSLTENYHGATEVGLAYAVHLGVMAFHFGPSYTFAYENPTTGHVSDCAPVVEITQGDQLGATPRITIAGSAQNTAAYNLGYTRIALYRTARESSQLRRVNTVVNNRNDGAAIVFTESAVTGADTALLDEAAPQDTNREPLDAFVSVAAWMGRLFALRLKNDIGRVYFSALNDEIPVGRGEESWPRRFNRYGMTRPVGLVSIGGGDQSTSGLLIQASDGDYTMDGYDNLTFTPPYRVPTRGSGGFRGGAIDVRGDLVQLYRDKRLFQGGAEIGAAVQDKLNEMIPAGITAARLHWFAYRQDDALFVSFSKTAGVANNYTLVFDYDHKRVNEWSFGFDAAGTTHTLGGDSEMAIGSGATIWRLLQNVWKDDLVTYAPVFRTAPIRFAGRQILRRVEIFVGPAASLPQNLTWGLRVRIDEDPNGDAYTFVATPSERQSASGRELVVEFPEEVIFNTIDIEVTFPATETEIYIERARIIHDDAQDEGDANL